MANKWKYNDDTIIREGQSWVDKDNIRHPKNWHIWSADEKKAKGLVALTREPEPDSRLYTWVRNEDDSITKTAKKLDDETVDGQTILGVKSTIKSRIKTEQHGLLVVTDWMIIRKTEKGTDVPSDITTYRDKIREKSIAMEKAIDDAADTDAMATILGDGTLFFGDPEE
eukprot:GHVU01156416.1.p1 GENE.GHVU01156416.1~~GHVU01156416.1.p1  ORF type:complete len:169 (-),score=22.74 GHVU01156416.1:478-984(-)